MQIGVRLQLLRPEQRAKSVRDIIRKEFYIECGYKGLVTTLAESAAQGFLSAWYIVGPSGIVLNFRHVT